MFDSKPQTTRESDAIRVLHVDDDSSFLDVSRQILKDIAPGLEVDCSNSVDEALNTLSDKEYDVVVSDYEMPVKNGLDFFRALKAKGISLPFILFTGKGREKIAIQALNLGADGYFNKQGNPETVYGELAHGIKSIFERRKTKLALDESENRCQTIMQQASEMIFINDSKSRFVYVNPQACKNLGYTAEEFSQMHVVDVDDNATESGLAALWPKVLAGETFSFETVHKRKDGSVYPVEVSLSAITIDEQQLVMGFARDISERKKMEEKLKESEERYRSIVELSPDGIAVASLKGKILMVNKAFLDLTGFSEYDIVGKHFTKLGTLRASDLPKYIKLYLDLLRGKKSAPTEFVYVRKDGSLRDAEAHFALIKRDGKKTGFQVILRDITDHKKKENETRIFSSLFELANDSITVTDFEGNIVYFNEAACKLRGYNEDEMAKMSLFSLNPPESSELVKTRITQIIKNGSAIFESENIRKDRTRMPLEVHSRIIDLNGKKLILAISRDITERKRHEEALRDSEEKFAKAFNYASNSVIITRMSDGKIIDVNDSLIDLLGYTTSELIGRTTIELGIWANPDERREIIKEVASKDFVRNREVLLRRKDGSTINVIGSMSIFNVKNEPLLLTGLIDITELKKSEAKLRDSETRYRLLAENSKDVIWTMDLDGHFTYVSPSVFQLRGFTSEEATQQSLTETLTPASAQVVLETFQKFGETGEIPSKYFELEATCKDGSTVWLEVNFSVFRDKEGKPQTIFGASRDITDRRNSEEKLRSSHKELEIVNEKLRVVGSLTRHDVGNKLMLAKSNLYLLKKNVTDSVLTKYLDTIDEAFNQSGRIFEFSNLYEKIGAEKPKDTNVEDCFDEAIKLIPHTGTEIVNKAQGLTVFADSMLRQLFYNLIDNSLKHGKSVSKIQLSYVQNDKKTVLIYEDNGVGISLENKSKIFSEGFTTGGLGLGLKLVKKMIEVYGWTIAEEGQEGEGAKFVISIPRHGYKENLSIQIPQVSVIH